ncbi:hypothetical protein BV210_16285 [Halorientalis sp. IM1011]|uniref:hypothetical protein n=1 Tax=Halorientalis sp. IM1011 TaxID=1932360 RepID=UPI00097CCEEE|nr:hypothetical protein [Halorientalis sp. IM1011]AQL44170.1 hypothetical protein BV210_16285 [Halorientalis sp. IM1011]
MRRRIYLIAGVVLALTSFPALLVGVTQGVYDAVGTLLLGTGGLLFVVAARRDEVDVGDWTLSWHQFVGGADVTLGLGFPLTLLNPVLEGTATSMDYTFLVAGVVGGLVLVFIGVDVLRGSRYVSLGSDEESAL